nr:MAG TPA: hypothetical protein [Caudoviricetes sp.]
MSTGDFVLCPIPSGQVQSSLFLDLFQVFF